MDYSRRAEYPADAGSVLWRNTFEMQGCHIGDDDIDNDIEDKILGQNAKDMFRMVCEDIRQNTTVRITGLK